MNCFAPILVLTTLLASVLSSTFEISPEWKRLALSGIKAQVDYRKVYLDKLARDPRKTLVEQNRGLDYPDYGVDLSAEMEEYFRGLNDLELQVHADKIRHALVNLLSIFERLSNLVCAEKVDPEEFGFFISLYGQKFGQDALIENTIAAWTLELNKFRCLIDSDPSAAKEQIKSEAFKKPFLILNAEYEYLRIESAIMAYDSEKTKKLIDEAFSTLSGHLGELREDKLSAQNRYAFLKLAMLLKVPLSFSQWPATYQRCQTEFNRFISEKVYLTHESMARFKRYFGRVYDELQRIQKEVVQSSEQELMCSPNYTVHRTVVLALSYPKELYAANSELDQAISVFYARSYKSNLINVYENVIKNWKSINERIEFSISPLRSDIHMVTKMWNELFPNNPVSYREFIECRD